jgi:3-dehydroquinate synthase
MLTPHPTSHRTVRVEAASRGYDVVIGAGLLAGAAARIGAVSHNSGGGRGVHVFADDGLPGEVLTDLSRRLDASGFRVSSSPVRATEEAKVLQGLYHMVQELARRNLERGDVVIALGGGITGDMAGFAAASYRRGIPWINCPTTLLAMVDASVGGKTGVNLRSGAELQKNMVGAFWQPALVLADVSTLETLTERTFRAGLAECVKHAMLSAAFEDEELMAWTKERLGLILERDAETLTELIARNVAIKARVVGGDEREESSDAASGRALLNLGHTFGHAIETLPMVAPDVDASLAPLQHGEAVALGLVCASRCAELMKLVGVGLTEAIRQTLRHAGLPVTAHHLPASGEIVERMRHDKKAAGGKLRLVLPRGEGRCEVVAAPGEDVLHEAIDAARP